MVQKGGDATEEFIKYFPLVALGYLVYSDLDKKNKQAGGYLMDGGKGKKSKKGKGKKSSSKRRRVSKKRRSSKH